MPPKVTQRKQFKTINVSEELKKEFDDLKEIRYQVAETNDQCLRKLIESYNEKKSKS